MKITYISHSGFCVEMENKAFIFDYYKGIIPSIDKNKRIYVFSSHKHHDHFTMDIFHKMKEYENVTYIFSNDIKLNEKYLLRNMVDLKVRKNIINISAGKELLIDDIKIKTYKSTDVGVAFLVESDEKAIYHAGDLNWWYWQGEPDSWNENMEKAYKGQIDLLKKEKRLDAAFVPLDIRQGENAILGINYFCECIDAEYIFPMHFWDDYTVFDMLENSKTLKEYKGSIIRINEENQQWII